MRRIPSFSVVGTPQRIPDTPRGPSSLGPRAARISARREWTSKIESETCRLSANKPSSHDIEVLCPAPPDRGDFPRVSPSQVVSDLLGAIRCPYCAAPLHESGNGWLRCETAGCRFPYDGIVADLSRRSGEVAELREDAPRKRGLGHRIAYNLDPLKSRFSPLVAYHARKTEAYYDRCLTDRRLAEEFRRFYLPTDYHAETGTVLDYGCGRGRLSALLGQLGFRVVGADLRSHVYWQEIPNGCFVVLPAGGGAPFADSAFDCVLHFGVLMYIRQPESHLLELRKKLRSGGVLSIQVANRECYRNLWAGRFGDADFFRLYTEEELNSLLGSAGFTVENVRYEGFYAPIFPLAVNFVRRILLARRFDLFDRNSLFVRLTPPRHRGTIHVIARSA